MCFVLFTHDTVCTCIFVFLQLTVRIMVCVFHFSLFSGLRGMCVNVMERQRDFGITGKCLESTITSIFIVTSSGRDGFSCLFAISKYLFRKFSKDKKHMGVLHMHGGAKVGFPFLWKIVQ